jgi:hypothetical protein
VRPSPGIPCALFAFEGEFHQDPDAICAAGMFKHAWKCVSVSLLDRPVIPDQIGAWRRAMTISRDQYPLSPWTAGLF